MAASPRLLRPIGQVSQAVVGIRGVRYSNGIPSIARPGLALGNQRRRWFSAGIACPEKKYTQDHEWVELSSDGKTGTIGITNYASHSLGDVVYVELPTVSLEVSKGDTIGAVESVKSASDILTPVSGTVVETNTALEEKPALINKGPEGDEGWLAKIELAEEAKGEVEGLMAKGEYDAFVGDGEGEKKGEGEGKT